jgi:alcohol dehydrogenase (cytochrome c)
VVSPQLRREAVLVMQLEIKLSQRRATASVHPQAPAMDENCPGNRYIGSASQIDLEDEPGGGAIRALNPKTGDRVWEYKLHTKPWSGVMSTAGKLVFGGSGGWADREHPEMEGYFYALDAETGKELWYINLGGDMSSSAITYLVKGKQLVTVPAGGGIFTFSLP